MFTSRFFRNIGTHIVSLSGTTAFIGSQITHPDLPSDAKPASELLAHEVKLQAQKMGVNYPVKVYTSHRLLGAAFGTSISGIWNSSSVVIHERADAPRFADARRFIISHELAHLKNKDNLNSALIVIVAIQLVAFSKISSPLFLMLLGSSSRLYYMWHAEKRADLTAAKYCSNLEIEAFYSLMSASESHRLAGSALTAILNVIAPSLIFSFCFPFIDEHPSERARINYLRDYVKQRNQEEPHTAKGNYDLHP